MCVFMYLRMNECMYTFAYTYIHTYVRTYVRTYVGTYVRMYVRTYVHTYVYIHTYMQACMHAYIHTCLHNCLFTYIDMLSYFLSCLFQVSLSFLTVCIWTIWGPAPSLLAFNVAKQKENQHHFPVPDLRLQCCASG